MSDGVVNFDAINADLVECQAAVLWNSPTANLEVLDSLSSVTAAFLEMLPGNRIDAPLRRLQDQMLSRLNFCTVRWRRIDVYANTTMLRLEIQRSNVSFTAKYLSIVS